MIRIAALGATGSFTFRLLRLNSRRNQLRNKWRHILNHYHARPNYDGLNHFL
jgi:hypothetical protein